ncbi:MAG TPA: flagellum-specific ATP synthase FliI, partial [Polyangiaceae bacterium]|nr:flagellum-specific ATP synthase FliI [Polyangiaceae bacterium]
AGVITALYTVLVEGDDLSDPIADSVRSIIDGHIVLSRGLAEKGHFPAIDVLKSISRLAPEIAAEPVMRAAANVRDMLSTYRDAQDLIQVGAYVAGSDPRIDLAIAAQPHIDNFLRQKVSEGVPAELSLKHLAQLAKLAEQQPQNRGVRK